VFNSVGDFEQWFSKPFASFRARGPGAAAANDEDSNAGELSQEERLIVISRLHQILRPFLLRRLKSQVLSQLPQKTERVIHCELSAWQRIIYRQIQRFGGVASESGSIAGGSMRGLSNIIMQLCVQRLLSSEVFEL
jgi:ATP-dependent helicase STH1/SNF2